MAMKNVLRDGMTDDEVFREVFKNWASRQKVHEAPNDGIIDLHITITFTAPAKEAKAALAEILAEEARKLTPAKA